ncbi:hypothetical protein [Paludisphaera sp.]|uniref:hypothetical protein n=1 Tax=Paludisphaera sp. TaxID=2017432 RepID=UPI00301E05E0
MLALEAAVVLVVAGDAEGYRNLVREMLGHFTAPDDPITAERIAKASLLLQPPEADQGCVAGLAERSVRLGQGDPLLRWFHLVRVMSAYRSNDFTKAVAWLEEAGKTEMPPEFASTRQSYLAMAEHHLGDPDRAPARPREASVAIPA